MSKKVPQQVLVTGGTGFIGSHLVDRLLQNGYGVTCLVRNVRKLHRLKDKNVQLVQGDCTQPESLEESVRGVSSVFHCAGLTKTPHLRDYYAVNHVGTKNILEACARYNPAIKKFILISSQAAAGPSMDGRPVDDHSLPHPMSDYGKSKLLAEEETRAYKDRLPVLIIRPSSVYGPRDRDVFELFRWASRGVTIKISGGERYFNLCYVEDLTAALLLAAENQTESGSIYFVADKRAYSWSEFRSVLLSSGDLKAYEITVPYAVAYLMALISELASLFTKKPVLMNRQKVLEAVQPYWLCDVGKIENELCFRAEYPLQKGMELTWQWYRKNRWL